MKGGRAEAAVAEMADRQRIVHRGIVALHRVEIRPQQKRRPARNRRPYLRGRGGLRERLAVGAGDAGRLPCRVGPAAAHLTGRAHLVAPMLAAVPLAAIDEIFCGRAQRVVGLAERRHLAVAVVVDADIEPDFRHPLRMSHRAGPGSLHLLRRAPALVDDAQRVDQLGLPIGFSSRLVPGERGKRGKHRRHVVLLHQRIAIGGLDPPQSQQRTALDAEIALDACEQRLVVFQRDLAVDDAPVGDAAVDVLPDLLMEFGLVAHLLEHAHVGFDPRHRALPGRGRDALGHCACAKTLTPFLEAWRRGQDARRDCDECGCAERGSKQSAAAA